MTDKVSDQTVSYDATTVRGERGRFLPGVAQPYMTQRKTLESTLRRAATQSPEKLRRACDAVLDSAAYGETWQERMASLTFIADRLDGKAVARIETSEGAPSDLGLADLVALVLNARKHDAIEAAAPQPTAEPALERPETWVGGVGDIAVE